MRSARNDPGAVSPSVIREGWTYSEQFLTLAQEAELLAVIRALPFQNAQYKEWSARRRIVSFGGRYDYAHHELNAAPPIPQFLHPLRQQVSAWTGIAEDRLQHAMVAEYQPGTPLGWHRDVPLFEEVIGISLLGSARLRFRPYPPRPGQRTMFAVELAPRSAYIMRAAARWEWQHAVSPTKDLRYSITFRTRSTVQPSSR
jgi:alkylated DNA repair dioxygenase AlkB